MKFDEWKQFNEGEWQSEINVRSFLFFSLFFSLTHYFPFEYMKELSLLFTD